MGRGGGVDGGWLGESRLGQVKKKKGLGFEVGLAS